MLSSSRRGISYPNPDRSDRPDIPAHIKNLVDALELDMIYAQGTAATRVGRTHMAGVLFYETDTGLSYYDDGAVWQPVRGSLDIGKEIDYAQVTSNLTVTATTEGTAQSFITGNSVAYDGTKVQIVFSFPAASVTGDIPIAVFLRDSTVLGQAEVGVKGSSVDPTGARTVATFDTPSAANHTYAVKLFKGGVGTSPVVKAGAGGSGNLLPAYLRVTRA